MHNTNNVIPANNYNKVYEHMNILMICKATTEEIQSQEQVCVHCFSKELNPMVYVTQFYSLKLAATFRVGCLPSSHVDFLLPAVLLFQSLNCVQLFWDPMDCSLPGSCVHGISQARILEWVAMPSSSGFSRPRDRTCISYISCTSTAWEAQIIRCPYFNKLEKAMAPHSSTLAWKIPWMEEPGRLHSMGSLGVGHD